MRWLAGLGLGGVLVVLACGGSSPPAEKVDVPPQPQALEIPPLDAGAPPPAPQSTPVAALEATPAADPEPEPAQAAAPDALTAARDPLDTGKRRPTNLVVTEVQSLVGLRASTPSTDPSWPAVTKRLADDYFGLGRSQIGSKQADAYREATKLYSDIQSSKPNYTKIDEVFYYLGLGRERLGDTANARKAYYELIKTAPSSKYIPYAYFAFGELFYAESKGDPSKAELAKQAYTEVKKYPASPIKPFAEKRLALLGSGRASRPTDPRY